MQDIFLEIFDTIDSLDEADSFENWSKQIADRRCAALIQNRREQLYGGKTAVISGESRDGDRKGQAAIRETRMPRIKALRSFFGKLIIGIVIAVAAACIKEAFSNFQSADGRQNSEAPETPVEEQETSGEAGTALPDLTETEPMEEDSTEGETTEAESTETEPTENTENESTETEPSEAATEAESTEPETTQAETVPLPEVGSTVTVGDFQLTWRGTYYEVTDISDDPEFTTCIPAEYEGLPVTSIGDRAFEGNHIGHITIPKSITHIAETAFRRCYGSRMVIVEEGNPAYRGIERDCLIEIASSTVILGRKLPANEGILHIGAYAYSGLSVNDIVIPEGVISIGENAFEYVYWAKTLTIPVSVTSIGREAFIGCSSLVTVNYPGTMAQWKAIEKGADWDKYTGAFVIHCTDGDI